jgi:hypothetical protein
MELKGQMQVTSWQEEEVRPLEVEGGRRLARVSASG